jgi:hypothetical protein
LNITIDECDLLDSIYLPSKYPVGSVLPDFSPDENICIRWIMLADRIYEQIRMVIPEADGL